MKKFVHPEIKTEDLENTGDAEEYEDKQNEEGKDNLQSMFETPHKLEYEWVFWCSGKLSLGVTDEDYEKAIKNLGNFPQCKNFGNIGIIWKKFLNYLMAQDYIYSKKTLNQLGKMWQIKMEVDGL